MTIVTPSNWLAELVKKSFLGSYDIKVINNGIDLNVFKSTESDFKEKNRLDEKKIILGVASVWNNRKGLDDFIELSKMLDDSYKIVLVGLSNKQMRSLPEKILGIQRTNSVQELAKIYTMADVFVNPSVEETMGLTTVEALACGTPVVVYNATAVSEVVDENCGICVDCKPKYLYNALKKLNFLSIDCQQQAKQYDKVDMYLEYINIYRKNIK